jgi:hypothetical protein
MSLRLALLLGVALALPATAVAARTTTPSTKDKADARAFAAAAARHDAVFNGLARDELTQIELAYDECPVDYESADPKRVALVKEFVAEVGAERKHYPAWKRMLTAWTLRHATDPTLKATLAEARADERWVRLSPKLPELPSICDILAAGVKTTWSDDFLVSWLHTYLAKAGISDSKSQAHNLRVAKLAPKLKALGLTAKQVSLIVYAV